MKVHWKYVLVSILVPLFYLSFVYIAEWESVNGYSVKKAPRHKNHNTHNTHNSHKNTTIPRTNTYNTYKNHFSNVTECKRLENIRKIVLAVNYNYPKYDNIQILKR